MLDNDDSAGFAGLRRGERVDVHETGKVPSNGFIEETMPELNIVWLRDLRTGERRILFTDECDLYRSGPITSGTGLVLSDS